MISALTNQPATFLLLSEFAICMTRTSCRRCPVRRLARSTMPSSKKTEPIVSHWQSWPLARAACDALANVWPASGGSLRLVLETLWSRNPSLDQLIDAIGDALGTVAELLGGSSRRHSPRSRPAALHG